MLWNLVFEKCEFCEEWYIFWKCEFCEKWDFENVNSVKNEVLKMWFFLKNWDFRIVNFCPCVWWDLFSSHSRFLLYVCYLFSLESQTRVRERDVTFLGLSQTEEEKRILHGYGATPFPHQEIIELDFNCCRVVAQLVHLHTLHNFELIS